MSAGQLAVKDAGNVTQNLSVVTDPTDSNSYIGTTVLTDPNTGSKAQIAQFHAADNQNPGGTANGLLTGGVAQLLNPSGNLDRQRETGADGVPAIGIATGANQLASQFSTTSTTAVTAGNTVAVTPTAMSGTNRGVAWSIQPGSNLTVDTGAAKETVTVISTTSTTFTAKFNNAHSGTWSIVGFVYNQARDSTLTDGASPGGIPAGSAYFWNQQLNAGAGGLEIERSAAGEMDGPAGAGGNVAFEYEHIGANAPASWASGSGAAQYDRARGVQGKGLTSLAISSAATGQAVVTLSSAAPAWLVVGQHVRLTNSTSAADASAEDGFVQSISGTAVTLGGNINNSGHTLLVVDTFAANGPGLSGFTAHGIGIEEEALYDPVSGLFYIERAATQDAMPAANIVAENPALWNGATMDRQRGNVDTAALITAVGATTTQTGADQTNTNGRGVKVVLNTTAIGTGSVTLSIQGKDAASGAYYTILAGAAVVTNTTNVYEVYPGIAVAANASASATLPRTWRVVATANNANAASYSVGASVIV